MGAEGLGFGRRPAMSDTQQEQSGKSLPSRRLPAAFLLFAAPAVALLLSLWLGGTLRWEIALGGVLAVAITLLGILLPHFRHLDALYRYVAALGRGSAQLAPPAGTSPILAPELDAALVEMAAERQARRQELVGALASREMIMANLPDPILLLGPGKEIVQANPAAVSLFGRTIEGRDITNVLRNPDVLAAIDVNYRGDPEEERPSTEIAFSLPGELERQFTARIIGLDQPTGDGVSVIVSLHELTAIYRTQQLQADFVANASHELRTPLSNLLGFTETLMGAAKNDGEARERFLVIMHEQATRMAQLIDDLLSLSRIELREHSPPQDVTDLNVILADVAESLEIKAHARHIRFAFELGEESEVIGDAGDLSLVFRNLLDNALKYGRAGTSVKVTTRYVLPEDDPAARRVGGPAIAIAVQDFGEGIPKEHIPRLTERFYRVDTARSRDQGGTGLGLAIVKHVLNRHHGLLNIESQVGEGSLFTVYLPAPEPAPAESEVQAASNRI